MLVQEYVKKIVHSSVKIKHMF